MRATTPPSRPGFAPVNTNYRYGDDELIYLFDNADAEAVVFHASFAAVVDQIRGRLPRVKAWLAVAAPGHPVPDWADDYEAIAANGARPRRSRPGAARATTCCSSTPAAPPACPRG